jgi:hypothetical protein
MNVFPTFFVKLLIDEVEIIIVLVFPEKLENTKLSLTKRYFYT